MSIDELKNPNSKPKKEYQVHVVPPPRKIKLRFVSRTYECIEKEPTEPINFMIDTLDIEKYQVSTMTKDSIISGISTMQSSHIMFQLNAAK